MPRSFLPMLFIASILIGPGAAGAALLSLTVVGGLTGLDGGTVLEEPLAQESLSGSTLTQLGSPLLFDPAGSGATSLTVRITNISESDVLLPDVLPGVSVLTGVSGVTGYSSRQNVGSGGAGRAGGEGSEGSISRTAVDLTDSLFASSSPASGSHGGGGGAATGVADNWVSVTGASGLTLAATLAGIRLVPGAWIDVRDFATILAFRRDSDLARIAIGLDLPTFTFGGATVTTAAWTGTFREAAPVVEPPPDPVTLPEPGALPLLGAGLAGLAVARRRGGRVVAREEGGE